MAIILAKNDKLNNVLFNNKLSGFATVIFWLEHMKQSKHAFPQQSFQSWGEVFAIALPGTPWGTIWCAGTRIGYCAREKSRTTLLCSAAAGQLAGETHSLKLDGMIISQQGNSVIHPDRLK